MRMPDLRRHRPSPAMAVALLSLFISVGGSSFAAIKLSKDSVTSSAIKNGQVKRADLAANAVDSSKVADGSLLSADFKTGQLPAGAPGPAGPAGATNVVVRTATGNGIVQATCLAGERATGGGGHSGTGYVVASAPVADPLAFYSTQPVAGQGYTPTSWSARAIDASGKDTNVTAWVVCASP